MLLSTAPATTSDEIRLTSGTLPTGGVTILPAGEATILPMGEVTILPAPVDGEEVFTILPFPQPGDDAFTFLPVTDEGDGIVTILPFPLPGDGEVTILPVEFGDEQVFTILPYPLPGEGPAESGFAIGEVPGKVITGGSLGLQPAEGAAVTIDYGTVPLEIVQFAGLADLFASMSWHV